ncbi:hypothetical protein DRN75_04360 [Nanoarchaeota archaeon]|nr:MAG: hypothetical protein DRN75_04360 [Nanoarchaeota archaeon]
MDHKIHSLLEKYKYNSRPSELTIKDLGKILGHGSIPDKHIRDAAEVLTKYRWEYDTTKEETLKKIEEVFASIPKGYYNNTGSKNSGIY